MKLPDFKAFLRSINEARSIRAGKKRASRMTEAGWKDAKEGKVVKAREDYTKYVEPEKPYWKRLKGM